MRNIQPTLEARNELANPREWSVAIVVALLLHGMLMVGLSQNVHSKTESLQLTTAMLSLQLGSAIAEEESQSHEVSARVLNAAVAQKNNDPLPSNPPSSSKAQSAEKPVAIQKQSPTPHTMPRREKRNLAQENQEALQALQSLRYEQALPLWLNRFRTYPEEAARQGLAGYGQVYLEVDRAGKIEKAYVLKSTGHDLLDQELESMLARAKPLPIPAEYEPGQARFRFMIGFSFAPEGNSYAGTPQYRHR